MYCRKYISYYNTLNAVHELVQIQYIRVQRVHALEMLQTLNSCLIIVQRIHICLYLFTCSDILCIRLHEEHCTYMYT